MFIIGDLYKIKNEYLNVKLRTDKFTYTSKCLNKKDILILLKVKYYIDALVICKSYIGWVPAGCLEHIVNI